MRTAPLLFEGEGDFYVHDIVERKMSDTKFLLLFYINNSMIYP